MPIDPIVPMKMHVISRHQAEELSIAECGAAGDRIMAGA